MGFSDSIDHSEFEKLLDSNAFDTLFEKTHQLLNSEDLNDLDRIELQIYQGKALNFQGELERAKVLMQEIFIRLNKLKTSETSRKTQLRIMYHSNMISILRKEEIKADIHNLENHIKSVYDLIDELGEDINPRILKEKSWVLRNQGILQWNHGYLDQALHYYHQALKIDETLDDLQSRASTLNNIGVIYSNKGDLNTSLDYYLRSLTLREELGNKKGIADALNNIGLIYRQRGEINHSLDNYQRSLSIYRELKLDHFMAHTLRNIATIYRTQGKFTKAESYLKDCLHIYKESSTPPTPRFITGVLADLVELMLQLNNPEEARTYLDELDALFENSDGDLALKLNHQIAQGLVYKHEKKLASIVKAEEIFRNIIDQEIIDHSRTLLATTNLIELLIFEYDTSQVPEILDEIMELLISIQQLAKDQKLYPTLIQTFIVRAKLAMIKGDYTTSKVLLQQAELNADEFGLTIFGKQVRSQIDRMNNELIRYKEILSNNADVLDRIKSSDLLDYLNLLDQSVM